MNFKKKLLTLLFLILIQSHSSAGELFVNQAGYSPSLPKIFYYNAAGDSFYVVEQGSNTIYYRGALKFFTSNDPATGMMLYSGDFSSFTREGNYFIRTSNNDISYQFKIAANVFDDVYRKSQKAFYYQRCGTPLFAMNAGTYARSSCHINDAVFHSSSGETGVHPSARGWHDAGDYGKYIVNAGITTGTLLMAYEQFPERFSADNLNILESGNKIPDLLDEVKYEIDWFLTMQAADGGVYFKITPEQFEGFVMPSNANATRYIYEVSSTATADFAAVMARFARVYKPFDSTYARVCLDAALKAWYYVSEHPDIVPYGGFRNPAGTATGEYGDGNDSDERLWAAAELYETTGDADIKDYFEQNYTSGGVLNSTMSWPNVKALAQLTYLESKQSTAAATVKENIKQALFDYCNLLVSESDANGFGVSISPGEYNWGSNSAVLNNAVLLIYGYENSGSVKYRDAALDQLNYILGVNGTSYSYITGVGKKKVMHPHHRPSEADGINEPVPGLLAGGPNQYLSDPVLKQNFNSSTPPALCFIDNLGSYASNEIAINWNAPLVFVAGYFNSSAITSVKDETGLIFPEEYKLYQNYPNPFNPSSVINYALPVQSSVSIIIYDTLGKEVKRLVDEEQSAGEYSVEFNGSDLCSGIYLCKMNTQEFTAVRKMMLIK